LTNLCGVSDWTDGYITNISNNGVLDTANKRIVWTTGGSNSITNIAPGGSIKISFSVNYIECEGTSAVGKDINNIASVTADNLPRLADNQKIRVFDVPLVRGAFAKGDTVNGRTSIRAVFDDNPPLADPFSMMGKTAYGETTTIHLYTINEGLHSFNNIVMQDMIPVGMEFVSASLPTAADGKIFYYTGTGYPDETSPPFFDHTNNASTPGAGWSTTVPSDPTTVTWVTMYVPCLKSALDSGLLAAACPSSTAPSNVTGNITMRAKVPTEPGAICKRSLIPDTGLFRVYNGNGSSLSMSHDDPEASHIVAPMPVINNGTSVTGPATIEAGDTGTYTITIRNTGTGSQARTTEDTELTIAIPTIQVGGTTKPLEFYELQSNQGVSYTEVRDINGNVIALTIKPGVLAAGASRTYTLTLGVPRGALSGANFIVNATLTAYDINNCQEIKSSQNATTSIHGAPLINSAKTHEQSMIKPGEKIDYTITSFREEVATNVAKSQGGEAQ